MELQLLVIEDSPADFHLLERQLRLGGLAARCHRVFDMQELATALVGTEWDLVISDYQVPGLEFEEAFRTIQACRPDLPVILVSGSVGEERAVDLLRAGVSDYVLKDRLARLPHTIRRTLESTAEARARRAAEVALAVSEERFRLAMEGARDGLWDWDLRTDVVYYSPAWKGMLGYADFELANHLDTWKHLCHPEDAAAALGRAEALITGREDRFEAEFRMRHKDGSYRWILSRAFLSRDPDGTPLRLVGTHLDLTERKRTEERLRQAAIVFDNTRDGIVIADRRARVLAINPAFTAITGYTEAEAVGNNLNILQSGRQDRAFYQRLWDELEASGTWQGELWNRRKNGELYLEALTISAVASGNGAAQYVGVFSDVTRLRQAQELEQLAHHDALTGLPNRLLLKSRLDHALKRCQRQGHQGAVLFLDLDRFKEVNDTLGHPAGDELLIQVAARLKERLRSMDTLARLGGDEFVAVLEDMAVPQEVARVADDLIARLAQPFRLEGGHEVQIGTSIGIALFPNGDCTADGECNPEALIQAADAALYRAKAAGRGTWRFHADPFEASPLPHPED